GPDRRNPPPEDVQVWVDDLVDEVDRRAQPWVVRHPRDPGEQDPDEDQDEVDEEDGVDQIGDVRASDRAKQGHPRTFASEASTAASRVSSRLRSSRAVSPASVM